MTDEEIIDKLWHFHRTRDDLQAWFAFDEHTCPTKLWIWVFEMGDLMRFQAYDHIDWHLVEGDAAMHAHFVTEATFKAHARRAIKAHRERHAALCLKALGELG